MMDDIQKSFFDQIQTVPGFKDKTAFLADQFPDTFQKIIQIINIGNSHYWR